MHHTHTHTNCNNNTKKRRHNNPSQTNHHPTTHIQQSTKGQKHRHTSNQHKRHQKQNRGAYKPSTQHPTGHHHNTKTKLIQKAKHLTYPTTPPYAHTESTNMEEAHHTDQGRHNFHKHKHTQYHKYTQHVTTTDQNTHRQDYKYITVAITYFPPRDTMSPHYNTVDTDIAYCIRHVTNIPDSILTGDVNAHSTLWYSHTDDHRDQSATQNTSY